MLAFLLAVPAWAYARDYPCHILSIIDGDSGHVSVDLGLGVSLSNETFRLTGIDTPELHSPDPAKATRAKVARAALSQFAPPGSSVVCRTEDRGEYDKYHRLLTAIVTPKGDATSFLIKGGYGVPYNGGKR